MLRLLISETMSPTWSSRLAEFAGDVEVVELGSAAATNGAIAIAFFSHDCDSALAAEFVITSRETSSVAECGRRPRGDVFGLPRV